MNYYSKLVYKTFEVVLFAIALLIVLGCTAGQGPEGPTGPQGPAGSSGSTGSAGVQGPAGLNGTVITVVQFCANVSPSYPGTFPEVGLCINNQLYAVYSANDGFLTEITPGQYLSNAVGSACNFTVSANCVVTP